MRAGSGGDVCGPAHVCVQLCEPGTAVCLARDRFGVLSRSRWARRTRCDSPPLPRASQVWQNIVMTGSIIFCLVLACLVKEKYTRSDAEDRMRQVHKLDVVS